MKTYRPSAVLERTSTGDYTVVGLWKDHPAALRGARELLASISDLNPLGMDPDILLEALARHCHERGSAKYLFAEEIADLSGFEGKQRMFCVSKVGHKVLASGGYIKMVEARKLHPDSLLFIIRS